MKKPQQIPTGAQQQPVVRRAPIGAGSSLQKLLVSGLLASVAIAGCDCDDEPNPSPTLLADVSFSTPAQGAFLGEADDANSALAGVQPNIALTVANVTTGSLRLSTFSDPDAASPDATVTLVVDGAGSYATTDLTLVEGDNLLTAELLNDGGTVVAEESVTVNLLIVAGEPRIEITAPVNGATLSDLDPALDGVQGNVTVNISDIPQGETLEVLLNGAVIESQPAGAAQQATFSSLTFPLGNVAVEVRTNVDGQTVQDRVDVLVVEDTPDCIINVSPIPIEGSCDFVASSDDLDLEEDGFQTEITVSVEQCEPERLILTLNGEDIEAFGLDGGSAVIPVTLGEGENTVVATATDDAGQETSSSSFTYVVDTQAPQIEFTNLVSAQVLTRIDDVDGDLSNGIDFPVEFRVEGVEPGTEMQLEVNGEAQVTQVTEESTAVFNVSLTESGNVLLAASLDDECLNNAQQELPITVDLSQSVLLIENPEDGQIYTAADDEDLDEEGLQVSFSLSVVEIAEGEEITVSCRRVGEVAFFERGTTTKPEDDAFEITVTLPEGELVCRAETVNGVTSDEVEIRVVTDAPFISITDPEDGLLVNTPTLSVSAFAGNADGENAALIARAADEDPEDGETYEALVVDGGVVFEGVVLDEGANVLTASLASGVEDEVQVTLDSQGPTITFAEPTVLNSLILPENDSTGTIDDGIQIDVRVALEDAHPGEEVCVTAVPGNTRCAAVDGDGEFTVEDLGVVPGVVLLTASATDAAGNTSTAELELTVAVDRAQVTIESPADGSSFAESITDVIVDVAGLSDDVDVVLVVNGVPGPTLPAGAPGETLTFRDVALQEGANTLRAELSDDRGTSVSPEVTVTVDADAPTLLFSNLEDGKVFTSADQDTSGQEGFQTNIELTVQGVEEGQLAALTVSCQPSGLETRLEAPVEDGRLVFSNVTLDAQSTCVLDAVVSDEAGQEGTASATVTIDRLAPSVTFGALESGLVTTSDDLDPDTDGIQVMFDAPVTNGRDGDEVCIQVEDDPEVCITLEGGASSVPFNYTFLESGAYTVQTRSSDPVGNEDSRSLEVLVDNDAFQIVFRSPNNNALFNAQDDSNEDALGLQTSVRVSGVAAMEGLDVRLCSDTAPADAEPCATGGFSVIATTNFLGAFATGDFDDVSLPEGTTRLVAESDVPDLLAPVISSELIVDVDTQAPIRTRLTLTSDDAADQLLGPNEDELPGAAGFYGRFVAQFEGVEAGQVATLRSTNTDNADQRLGNAVVNAEGEAVFVVPLLEGAHEVTATVFDAARNLSEPGEALTFVLDVTAPELRFNNVQNGQEFSAQDDLDPADGFQFSVRGTSDALGRTVALSRVVGAVDSPDGESDDIALGFADVEPSGLITFASDVVFPEGESVLVLRVDDLAGNVAVETTRISVDSIVPEIEIVSPASGSTFDTEDPAFENQAGFQVEIRLTGSEPGSMVQLTNQDTGALLSEPFMVGDDNSATSVITLSSGETDVVATVTDAFGNTSESSVATYTVTLAGCGLRFVEPSSNPVLISTDDDDDISNGVSTTWRAVVDDILGCATRPVRLIVNGTEAATVPVNIDGSVEFAGVSFANSSNNTVIAEVTDLLGNTNSTDLIDVRVDLLAPEVAFTTPELPVSSLGTADDLVADPGFQTRLELSVLNGLAGTLTITSSLLPDPIVDEMIIDAETLSFESVTLPAGEHVLTATVINRVGVEVTATATVTVDLDQPDGVVFTADLLNRRTGQTDVRWTGVDAAQYMIFIADEPITDDNVNDPDVVTLLDSVEASAAPGEEESFQVDELAWEPELQNVNRMYFLSVVAMDEAGNMSPITDSVDLGVGLLETRFNVSGSDNFGFNVQGIGDVNNDGLDDAVITDASASRAWVLYGRAGDDAMPSGDLDDLQELTPQSGFYGVSASRLGDINGDGIADFAIAAPFEDFPSGNVYLFFGQDNAPVSADPDVRIQGANDDFYAGLDVAPAGNFADSAGENLQDIFIGAPGDSTTGHAYVVLGRTLWPAVINLSDDGATNASNSVVRLVGAAESDEFGYQGVSVGDANGDGFDDLAVGSNGALSGQGAVYLFLGGDLSSRVAEVDGIVLQYTTLDAFFARELVAGDVSGDGTVDLVVGSSKTDEVTVFLFDEGIPAAATLSWASPQAGLFSEKMALSDLTDDGLLDLVVGGFGLNSLNIYFNETPAPFARVEAETTLPNVRVSDTGDWAQVVSPLGDFNGDGLEDIIVNHRTPGEVVIFY